MHDVRGLVADHDALMRFANDISTAVVCQLEQGFGLLPITTALQQELRAKPVVGSGLPQAPINEIFPELHALALAVSAVAPVAYISTEYFGGAGEQDAVAWQHSALVFSPVSPGYGREWPNSSISQALRSIGVEAAAGKDEFDSLGLGNHRETHRWAAAFAKAD